MEALYTIYHRFTVGEIIMTEKVYITSKQMATFICPKMSEIEDRKCIQVCQP